MKNIFLVLFFGLIFGISNIAIASSIEENLRYLNSISSSNMDLNSSVSEDSIIKICGVVDPILKQAKDYTTLFKVRQLAVESYCVKGNIGLAIDKVHIMYDEAKDLNHKLGCALAIQAIGTTYIFSNQFKEAAEAFSKAESEIMKQDDDCLKLRLLLQQIHTSLSRNDYVNMGIYLSKAESLLKPDRVDMQDYRLCIKSYRTLYYIGIAYKEDATKKLSEVLAMIKNDGKYDQLRYLLNINYNVLLKDYNKALLYSDSTLALLSRKGNMSQYRAALITKIDLLEKSGLYKQACEEYERVREIADTLNMNRYMEQLNSLRVLYLVDQLKIENVTEHNNFLNSIIFWSVLVLFLLAILSAIIIRKNRELVASNEMLAKIRKDVSDSIKLKSMFLSNMSHELRTPLNAIVGFSDMLANEDVVDVESKELYGNQIKQNADLLTNLINDVIDVSTLKDKNIKFKYDKCDIITLCNNVVNSVEQVKRTQATVIFKSEFDTLELNTDSNRLQQVLINLLVNATKFTKEGTITLIVTIDRDADDAIFTVEDTGCGIPIEKQDKIFERFEKLHEGVHGYGLGLSICQLIIEHIGGRIWIDSEYTKGARFVFTHPLGNKLKQQKNI